MPFIGIIDDQKVIPEDVEDGVRVRCVICDGEMTPRGPDGDGRARHFRHIGSSKGNCSGSESNQHNKMKSIALSTLRREFSNYTRCESGGESGCRQNGDTAWSESGRRTG